MRIVNENKKLNKKSLIPETLTDIFVLQNLIEPDDYITSKTHRRVRKSGTKGREGDKGERVTLTLTIQVFDTNFQESEVDNRLRIKGIIIEGPEDIISLGTAHTINVVPNQLVTIQKKEWLLHHQKYIEEAIKSSKLSAICLLAIERGVATVSILDNLKLNIIADINYQLPGKIADQKQREKAEKTFFKRILDILTFQVSNKTKIYVIGGLGHFNQKFFDFLKENWSFEGKTFHLENVSSGTVNGINEIIKRGILDQIASDYQYLKIERIVEEFIHWLAIKPNSIGYGIDNIKELLEMGALETVLISDRYFRTSDHEIQEKLNYVMTLIKQTNCKFYLVEYKSSSGKKIEQFGKIIGLARFEVFQD
jgi:protein pelota